MKKIEPTSIPIEVKEELNRQIRCNNGAWLATNYCEYYPNKVNFIDDKIVKYTVLENGEYAIIDTYMKS